jgi:hypothetical protein
MEKVSLRDDFEGNNWDPVTILCTEWVKDESGEVVLGAHHKVVRNHAWAMGLLELHSTRSGFRHNCNSQEGRIIMGDQAAARTRGRGPAGRR